MIYKEDLVPYLIRKHCLKLNEKDFSELVSLIAETCCSNELCNTHCIDTMVQQAMESASE